MYEKIVQLNELLETEAKKLTNSAKCKRIEERQGYRSGHYNRNLATSSGDVTLHMPRLKGISFEVAIIERYCRNWGGEYENVVILVAIAVNEDGYCEVLGATEGIPQGTISALWAFTS